MALTLLAFGVLAVSAGHAAAIRLLTESRMVIEMAVLAQRRMEKVRSDGCAAVGGEERRGPLAVTAETRGVIGGRMVIVAVRRLDRPSATDTLTFFQRCAS